MLIANEVLPQDMIPLVAISMGGLVVLLLIIGQVVRGVIVGTARERTRREVAAYVAEGTMSTEEAERLLKAGASSRCCGVARAKS